MKHHWWHWLGAPIVFLFHEGLRDTVQEWFRGLLKTKEAHMHITEIPRLVADGLKVIQDAKVVLAKFQSDPDAQKLIVDATAFEEQVKAAFGAKEEVAPAPTAEGGQA